MSKRSFFGLFGSSPKSPQRVAPVVSEPAPEKPPRRPIAVRAFNAARTDRLFADWIVTNRPLNEELRFALQRLRDRSRDLEINSWVAARYFKLCEIHMVGPDGFGLQVKSQKANGQDDIKSNQRIEQAFWQWASRGVAELTGRYSFNDLLRLCARTAARDGEILLRVHDDIPPTRDNPFGFAIEIINSARLDHMRHGYGDDETYHTRLGVQMDGSNRPVGYWVILGMEPQSYPGGNAAVLLDANSVIHAYRAMQPEQVRGFPWMCHVMEDIFMLEKYQEGAVTAARIGAAKMGFFKSVDGDLTALADDISSTAGLITDAEPGTFTALPPGYDFQSFNPDYPHQLYGEFTSTILRTIAAGLNISHHSLTTDLTQVNFSSIRAGTLEERENWKTLQDWMIESILTPIYRRWLIRSLNVGAIDGLPKLSPDELYKRFSRHEWRGRRWPWVDPLKDIQAVIEAVNAGLKSPQQAANDLGVDIETVLQEIARFNDMAKQAGLNVAYGMAPPVNPTPAQVNPNDAAAAA